MVSLAFSHLFLPGLRFARAPGGGDAAPWVLLAALACAVCYVSTAVFLHSVQGGAFGGIGGTGPTPFPRRTVAGILRALPKLACALAVFAAVFACISGALSMLIYHVFAAGLPAPERKTPILAAVIAILVLSLPFWAQAFSRFASGDGAGESASRFLREGARIGRLAYLRFLAIGAAAFGLALAIRFLCGFLAQPAGEVASPLLTAAVFGAAIPLSFAVHQSARGPGFPAGEPAFDLRAGKGGA